MDKLLKVKIKELRKKKGLTQSALSQSVGVTEETISNWENGKRGIEWIERVCKLCEALECSPKDLLTDIHDTKIHEYQTVFSLKGDETLDIGFSIIENFIRQHSTVKASQSDWIAYIDKEINRLKDVLDEEVIVEIEGSGKVSFKSSLSLKSIPDTSSQ